MPVPAETRDELAGDLYEAWQDAEPIDRLTADHDLTIEDAYDVQRRFVDRRLADGAAVVGHKIGLTSAGIQDQLGVDQPDFGRLLDTMAVEGPRVPTADLIAPRVEPEIGFLIDEPLEPPVTALDVLIATHAVLPVLEIIDSRVRDWDIRIEDTIADNASSARYLTGGEIRAVGGSDLSLEGVKLYRNGELADSGVGAAVLDHPARAVAWLAETLDELGERLEAGHLVLSGSMTPATDVASGDVVTAEFTSLGSVTARFE
jgi:2-keto-4-pentenoate hydratase